MPFFLFFSDLVPSTSFGAQNLEVQWRWWESIQKERRMTGRNGKGEACGLDWIQSEVWHRTAVTLSKPNIPLLPHQTKPTVESVVHDRSLFCKFFYFSASQNHQRQLKSCRNRIQRLKKRLCFERQARNDNVHKSLKPRGEDQEGLSHGHLLPY